MELRVMEARGFAGSWVGLTFVQRLQAFAKAIARGLGDGPPRSSGSSANRPRPTASLPSSDDGKTATVVVRDEHGNIRMIKNPIPGPVTTFVYNGDGQLLETSGASSGHDVKDAA